MIVNFYHTKGDTAELKFLMRYNGVPYHLIGDSIEILLYLTKFDLGFDEAVVDGLPMVPLNQTLYKGVASFDWAQADSIPEFTPELYKGRVWTNIDGEELTFPSADYGEEYFTVTVHAGL